MRIVIATLQLEKLRYSDLPKITQPVVWLSWEQTPGALTPPSYTDQDTMVHAVVEDSIPQPVAAYGIAAVLVRITLPSVM